MGTEPARLNAAITKNIDQALEDQNITRHELSEMAGISKSTFYRNMKYPAEKFTIRETGQIAEALGVGLLDILKDEGPA